MREKAIASDINKILRNHGIVATIEPSDILVTGKTVTDSSAEKLSQKITEFIWPSIGAAKVCHYTSLEAYESILKKPIFRLANIEKRISHGEIRTFYETHGFKGYLEPDEHGKPKYQSEQMGQFFYASFTELSLGAEEERLLWEKYAGDDGVRMTLEITATNVDFRKMVYEPKPGVAIPLLAELTAAVRRNHGREFMLRGISKLCAFYLDGQRFGGEREYRVLVNSAELDQIRPVGSGPFSYIELPLNEMSVFGYKFQITEVQHRT